MSGKPRPGQPDGASGGPCLGAVDVRTTPRAGAYGVYQIGAVYARSCVEVGAPSGVAIPNRNAS